MSLPHAVQRCVLLSRQPWTAFCVGVLCEIVNEDGSMARKAELLQFAQKHDLKIITIADLVKYRICQEHQMLTH